MTVIWNALMTAVIVALLAGLFSLALPPVYRATATVVGVGNDSLIIQSGELLREALKRASTDLSKLKQIEDDFLNRNESDLELVSRRLKVEQRSTEHWIDISIEAADANTAASLANAIATAYIKHKQNIQISPQQKLLLSQRLKKTEDDLIHYLNKHPSAIDLPNQINEQRATLNQLDLQLANLQQQILQSRTVLAQIKDGDLSPIMTTSGVAQAMKKANELSYRRVELKTRYGSQHNKMIALNAELNAAEAILDKEIGIAQQSLASVLALRLDEHQQALLTQNRSQAKRDEMHRMSVDLRALEVNVESALRHFDGVTDDIPSEDFAGAIAPAKSLSRNRVYFLFGAFLVTFFLMIILTLINRSTRR